MEKFSIKVVDEETLSGYKWEVEKPKANIIVMEGMEEHAERYDGLAVFLNEKGFNVYGLDCYGQGLNVNKDFSNVGVWPKEGFAKQVTAFDMLVQQLKAENNIPTYLFCHSMGSFMGQDYIQRYPGHVQKVILCGSGAKNGGVPLALFFGRIFVTEKKRRKKSKILNKLMFGNFNNKIKNPRTSYDWLTHDEALVDKYIADPLCGFGPNRGFCVEFLKGMSRLYKKNNLRKINKDQKIFLICGEEDPVANYGKYVLTLEKMYKQLGLTNVSNKIYAKARHELLNEFIKEEVFNDIANFYNE